MDENEAATGVVKSIIEHRSVGNGYEYLVSWGDSRVHETDFLDMAVIKKYWKNRRITKEEENGPGRPKRVKCTSTKYKDK